MNKLLRRFIAIVFMSALALMSLTGCGKTAASGSAGMKIVTTVFPEYDWVMNILGEDKGNADVTFLLSKGVDIHSFQPSADDILKMTTCDLLIYVGGESDEWVEDLLETKVNKDMRVINLMDVLGDEKREEELKEGMQASEEHDHGEDHDHEEDEEEIEYDEHVWLSLKNAKLFVKTIADEISSLDASNAATYKTNAESYIAKLDELDSEYSKAVSESSLNTVLFCDRFPFLYLTKDYGLDYFAAFKGCEAETEASFETVTFLAKKLDELKLPAVLTIENSDNRIAETVIKSASSKDVKILCLNSMQSVNSKQIDAGTTYLSVMNENLKTLKQALSK